MKRKKEGGEEKSFLSPTSLELLLSLAPSLHRHTSGRSSVPSSDPFFPMMQYSMCSQLAFVITFAPNLPLLMSSVSSIKFHAKDIFQSSSFLLSKKHSPFFLKFSLSLDFYDTAFFSSLLHFSHSFAVSNHIIFSIKCSNPGVFKPLLGNFFQFFNYHLYAKKSQILCTT